MENKKNNKRNILIIVIIILVVAILLGVIMNSSETPQDNTSSSETSSETASQEINNVTDIDSLKSSEYTNSNFDTINIGDSVDTVESAMGTLTAIESDGQYDEYSYEDNGTNYVFYFEDDALAQVSVYI